jgi:hypothetical protein
MENNQIASIIQQLYIASLYGNKSSYPKNNAQLNLEGRTHWASDENLRFFGCRISSAHETESGLLFYVIESSFLDFNKTKRGFRYAIFDIFGECVSRLDMEDAFKTSDQARKAMREALETFDTAEHYKQALERIAKRADKEAERTREALAQLTQEALA